MMQEDSSLPVVTIDDDAILPRGLFKTLWDVHERFPDCVVATRTHRITCSKSQGDYKILPYSKWEQEQSSCILKPSHDLLSTGLGGVLYPAGIMPECCFDADAIRETCQFGDDIWLKVMELSSGVRVVDCGCGFIQELIDGSQDCALFHENQERERNDVYLDKVLQYLDEHKRFGITSSEVVQRIVSAGEDEE